MNIVKQDCYNFIALKVQENKKNRHEARAELGKKVFEERYNDIPCEAYGEEMTTLAQGLVDLWSKFSVEVTQKDDTNLGSLGWDCLIKAAQSSLSLSDNIQWFENKIIDSSTISEKKIDELDDKFNKIEMELRKINRNLKTLPSGKKCKEYLEELGFILPEIFTKPKNEVFSPINKSILGLPENSKETV